MLFYPLREKNDIKYGTLNSEIKKKLFEDYAKESSNEIYYGMKLKLGLITIDDIKKDEDFVDIVDNWIIFNRNDKYLSVVNSNPIEYHIGSTSFTKEQFDFEEEEPIFFYLKKESLKPVSGWLIKDLPIRSYHQKVIDVLNSKSDKKVKSFWNFFGQSKK